MAVEARLIMIEEKLDKLYTSSEKMRRYFLITLVVTLGAILIPLFVLPLVIPSFLASQSGALPAGL